VVIILATRLDTLNQRYADYIKAEEAILSGAQEYRIGTRLIKRADLSSISEMIKYLEKEITNEQSKQLGKGRNKVIGVIPRDF
jgi:hypothetical protein